MVASSEFVHAAHSQAEALGMPDLAAGSVFVQHPIQDATDEEMRVKARDAIDAIVAALTAWRAWMPSQSPPSSSIS